jgi:predicted dehydrogenase
MTRSRIAVVGCGHLGTIHARLLAQRQDVELVAVVDPFPASRDRVAAAHGCLALSEPAELIGVVSAAVIAAPTGLHAAVALPLLEAGIDLLIEKPLAATVEDARNIVTSARRQGRTVAVGHVERFNPAWELAVERAGRINYLEASRLAPFTFRSLDVGVVHDLMIHDIDLVLSLEPGRLEHVEAAGVVATGGHEDAVRARLTFSSGLVADLSASRIHPVAKRSISMWSTAGTVEVDFTAKTVEIVGPSAAVRSGQFVATAVPPADVNELKEKFFERVLPRELLTAPDRNAIACEHEDFLAAIRDKRSPRVSAAAGAAALEVANQVIDSLVMARFAAPAGAPTVALPQRHYPTLPRRKTG